jgi:phosphoenolpyruvate carboxylase
MRQLLADPVYQLHLAARGNRQCVHIGYTEGSRDSGFMATRLAAHDAQRELAATLAQAGVQAVLVHARGGSVPRGGSRIDALVTAAPPDSINGILRLTEQGETVSQSYGLRPNAMRTLERAFSALSLATAARQRGTVRAEQAAQHACVATAAASSQACWRALVLGDREFYDYFRAVTPIDVIERMQIGSRTIYEGSRNASAVQSIRSTPWVFAWSQSRHMIPGWYGSGTGLAAAVTAQSLAAVQDCYASWPFFTLLVDDLERMLARTDLRLARHYDGLANPSLLRFASVVQTEYTLACEQVLQIKQATELLDNERTLQRAIQLRNPYVDPMHLMQVDLLRRWRASLREDEDLFRALLASVSGIAQGLQTTG